MKYFFVDAFFIEPGDVWLTNEEIARVKENYNNWGKDKFIE